MSFTPIYGCDSRLCRRALIDAIEPDMHSHRSDDLRLGSKSMCQSEVHVNFGCHPHIRWGCLPRSCTLLLRVLTQALARPSRTPLWGQSPNAETYWSNQPLGFQLPSCHSGASTCSVTSTPPAHSFFLVSSLFLLPTKRFTNNGFAINTFTTEIFRLLASSACGLFYPVAVRQFHFILEQKHPLNTKTTPPHRISDFGSVSTASSTLRFDSSVCLVVTTPGITEIALNTVESLPTLVVYVSVRPVQRVQTHLRAAVVSHTAETFQP